MWRIWIVSFALFVELSGPMRADTLNYTWSAPGSGTFDGVAFGSQYDYFNFNIHFTMTADSGSVVSSGAPGYPPNSFAITGPVTVSVNGVGSDTITDPITIFENYGYYVLFGLSDATTGSGFNISKQAFCGYPCTPPNYLAAPNGPFYGRGFPASGTYNTTHGSLVFTGAPFYTTPSFEVTEAPSTVTPEPSSLVLLVSGALSLFAVVRRRRRIC